MMELDVALNLLTVMEAEHEILDALDVALNLLTVMEAEHEANM